jgi:hypothetical protein
MELSVAFGFGPENKTKCVATHACCGFEFTMTLAVTYASDPTHVMHADVLEDYNDCNIVD